MPPRRCLTDFAFSGREYERIVSLPPNYDTFALQEGLDDEAASATIATGEAKQVLTAPEPTRVITAFYCPTADGKGRLLRGNFSEFPLDVVEALRDPHAAQEFLLEAIGRVYRPLPGRLSAPEGAQDMAVLTLWLKEVAKEELAAARLLLGPGEAIIVDNYRCDHGREPYTDLGKYTGNPTHCAWFPCFFSRDQLGW